MVFYIIIAFTMCLSMLSCQSNNKTTESVAVIPTKNLLSKEIANEYIHTSYKYNDYEEGQIVIQNSYPKGGLEYIHPNGEKFRYVVFWSQIINTSNRDIDVHIEFPSDSINSPNTPSIYFKLLIPKENLKLDQVHQFNYGLEDLNNSIDDLFYKPTSVQTTIPTQKAHRFYVVALSNKGVKGVIRAGFSLEKQTIHFKVNEIELECGHIEFRK